MKKITYLILALLLGGFLQVFSQTQEEPTDKISLGIMGGINFATKYFPNSQDAEDQRITALPRFGVGAVLDIRLSKNLHARIEPMYLQKGGNIEEGQDVVNQPEGQIRSSSIEIPLLIQYAFGNKIQPYLIAGPTMGYNLKSEIEFDLTGLNFTGDMKDVTATFDLGITFGGGVQVPVGFGAIFLEGRYAYGLVNQRTTGTTTVSSNGFQIDLPSDKEEDKSTNRGFQLLAGVLISL